MAWDDAKKAKAIELYQALNPTPANSMECVAEVAEKVGETPNGVRMILTKAEVYIKKEAAATTAKASGTAGAVTGTKRVSKEDAIAALAAAIEESGASVDNEILSKLTGKAAQYLTEVISGLNTKLNS